MAAISNVMRLTSFTIEPGAEWTAGCQVARFPEAWLKPLLDAYHRRPEIKPGWSLPTRSLVELLIGLDPAILYVSSKLTSDRFIIALPGADSSVLAAGIASWATTAVTLGGCDFDWWETFRASDLHFQTETINLLEYSTYPNLTAAGAAQMFTLLPSYLAQHVSFQKMPLLGRSRNWIVGPPRDDWRRSAVLWPPVRLESTRAGDALATAKVTFHVETVPSHPVPIIHADLSTSRFPLMPVTYVPARGDGPPGATIWLQAPEGFLREHEPHTLLAGAAWQVWDRESRTRQWQWKPGLATTLSRLTHLPFPNPDKVFIDPAAAADEGKIRAYVLYSEGTKSLAGDIDDHGALAALAAGEETNRARSFVHIANTGLGPLDHIEVHEQLDAALGPLGIRTAEPCRRAGKRSQRKVKPAEISGQSYTLEAWTQSDLTREAILATLEHHHGLTPTPDPDDPSLVRFAGNVTLQVILKNVGSLGAGVDREEGNSQSESTRLGAYANEVQRHLGDSPDPRATIFELEDDRYFARARKIDPKPALKKAFARTDRRLQCLQPVQLFTPPATPPKNTKKKPPAPYPGTRFAVGAILRTSAAINDALRQLGRLGSYETPDTLPDLEQIGIWLHHSGSTCIPIVIRLQPGGTATAHLASSDGTPMPPLSYSDLPKALATGKGRIPASSRQKNQVAHFLRNALGIGDAISQDTHDRVVFVRSATFRKWGWDWLQDKHIQPDQLILPGHDLDDETCTPTTLSPHQCPGLRIVRVRDRSSTDEVPRGFAADYKTTSVRISGLFHFTGRIFYSINPRSDQMQTPLGATKLDPDILRNFTLQAANPTPLEIYPVFLQPDDDPAAYAALTSSLRRTYLHTEQATRFPAPLHLCKLADEYL
jgi:hypothetical protein